MNEANMYARKYREFVTYVGVGVSSMIFNWIIYSVLVSVVPMAVANAASWVITVVFTFLLNKVYVFESRCFQKKVVLREMVSFLTSRGVTGVLEIVLQPQLYAWGMTGALLGVEGLEAKVTVCIGLSIVNYFSAKWIVFRPVNEKRVKSA